MAGKNLNNRDLGLSPLSTRAYINDILTILNFNIYKKAYSLFIVKNYASEKVKRLTESVSIYRGQVYVKPFGAATGTCITPIDSLTELLKNHQKGPISTKFKFCLFFKFYSLNY